MKTILHSPWSLLLLSFFFSATTLSAQSSLENLGRAPSPQATDLGRFGDIPMSYYTGRANITIPIHTFTERGVTLDINLSYDTSGLLMNKLPGWVGPGWTLNAGGCITRVQNNFCDEMVFDSHLEYSDYQNYFKSHALMVSNGHLNGDYITNLNHYSTHDFSPDIFYFNFMGKSGHFFLGNDGEWKVSSDDNLVVEFDYNNSSNFITPVYSTYPQNYTYKQPKAIKGFTMYDDEGTKYVFGCDTAAIEYSIDLFHTSDQEEHVPWTATSWFLTKVIDRFGNQLFALNYTRGKFMVQLYKSSSSQTFHIPNYDEWSASSSGYSGTLNLPVYLSQITTRSGEVAFFAMKEAYPTGTASRHLYPSLYANNTVSSSYPYLSQENDRQYPFYYLQNTTIDSIKARRVPNPNSDKDPLAGVDMQILDSITVCQSLLNGLQTYTMEYDSIGRLHLSGISIRANCEQEQHYSFNYNNYAGVPQDYLTDQHDHWGYLNKKYLNSYDSIMPFPPHQELEYEEDNEAGNSGTTSTTIINRAPTLYYAQRGMLTEIIYPTGGKTQLEYELNDYSSVLSANRQNMEAELGVAGGLRIKTIRDIAEGSVNKVRTYSYKDAQGVSSGQLFARPYYSWSWETSSSTMSCSLTVPVIPLCTSSGTHIGYSTITETFSDGVSHQFSYSNFSDVKDEMPVVTSIPSLIGNTGISTPYDRFGELNFMRGRLLTETVKDDDGLIWKTTNYTYRQDTIEFMNEFSYASNISVLVAPSGNAANFGIGNIYKLYHPKYDLASIVTSIRQNGGMITDTCTYAMQTFKNHISGWSAAPFFRKCMQETLSRVGSQWIKAYNYATHSSAPYFMPICRTETYIDGSLTAIEATEYGYMNGFYVPQYETTQLGGGPVDTLVTYHSYETNGNIRSFTRKGEYPTQLFWKLNKLVASVTTPLDRSAMNCPNQSIGYLFGDPWHVIELNADGRSIFDVPDTQATTYVYDSGGRLISSASGNGLVTYYLYDALGRLTEIQDADHNTLQRFTYHYSTGN